MECNMYLSWRLHSTFYNISMTHTTNTSGLTWGIHNHCNSRTWQVVREGHYCDVISETRGTTSDSNNSILSPNTHMATVIPSTSTPVHLIPSHSGWRAPGDPEAGRIDPYSVEVGGWASSCEWERALWWYSYNNCVHVCLFCEILYSLPITVRLLLLPEGVLMLDTLHWYSPTSLPVTVSVWV